MPVIFISLIFSFITNFFAETPAGAALHPFHVSATEIEYIPAEKKIEISTKVFTDDFENALAKIYKTKIDVGDAALKTKMDALVKDYALTHLGIRSNGVFIKQQLYGWEVSAEAVYIYTTAATAEFNPKQIMVEDTYLHELFTDQINIVHFIINGVRKSNKIVYPERKIAVTF